MKPHTIIPTLRRVFAAALAFLAAFHAGAAQPELGLGTTSAYPGATASLPVELVDATDAVAAQLDVRFDSARAALQPVTAVTAASGRIVRSRRLASGVQRVLVYSLNNVRLPNDTPLAALPVTLRSYYGSGPLTVSNAIVARADASILTPLSVRAGAVEAYTFQLTAEGGIRFFFPAEAGAAYRVQASTNFVDWLDLSTNRTDADFLEAMDADAKLYPYRFYRWVAMDEAMGSANSLPSIGIVPSSSAPFALQLTGAQGYTVQMSSDLQNWVDLRSSHFPDGKLDVSSILITNSSAGFFRVRRHPQSGR